MQRLIQIPFKKLKRNFFQKKLKVFSHSTAIFRYLNVFWIHLCIEYVSRKKVEEEEQLSAVLLVTFVNNPVWTNEKHWWKKKISKFFEFGRSGGKF